MHAFSNKHMLPSYDQEDRQQLMTKQTEQQDGTWLDKAENNKLINTDGKTDKQMSNYNHMNTINVNIVSALTFEQNIHGW